MRIKLWMIVGAALAMLLTSGLAGVAQAQTTARGYCAGLGDSNWWRVSVPPGYCYTIWIRADNPDMDCDLYVYDCWDNLLCSSTGPGPYESCTICSSYCSTYKVLVTCNKAGWYTIGIF